jgi:tRNA uridine 5-carboxymethylaminomethyl modification enzyme
LISDEAWADFEAKQARLQGMKQLLQRTKLSQRMMEFAELRSAWTGEGDRSDMSRGFYASLQGQTLAQFLKRPEVAIEQLAPILWELQPAFFDGRETTANPNSSAMEMSSLVKNELKSVETEIKYEGYLQQQQRAIDRLKKAEQRFIPEWFDYDGVSGLSREMQEKLRKIRPRTIGQASRIPGVTPAAVSLVNVYIDIQAKRREHAAV